MKFIHNKFIGIYENAFSQEYCDSLISNFDSNLDKTLSRQQSGLPEGNTLNKNDLSYNFSDFEPQLFHKFVKIFFEKFYPFYQNENPALETTGYHTIFHGKIQKTLPTQGYHIFHHESESIHGMHRLLAYTLYLNDVEEGGETEFLYQSLRVKPKTGTLCIFPAHFTHVHRGNPPLSGEKYILTGWIEYADPKDLSQPAVYNNFKDLNLNNE